MLLTTPDAIRTLQRKRYAKAKQERRQRDAIDGCMHRRDTLSRAGQRWLGKCACLGVKNIGKPCAEKPHARFDEGRRARACSLLYLSLSHAGVG